MRQWWEMDYVGIHWVVIYEADSRNGARPQHLLQRYLYVDERWHSRRSFLGRPRYRCSTAKMWLRSCGLPVSWLHNFSHIKRLLLSPLQISRRCLRRLPTCIGVLALPVVSYIYSDTNWYLFEKRPDSWALELIASCWYFSKPIKR